MKLNSNDSELRDAFEQSREADRQTAPSFAAMARVGAFRPDSRMPWWFRWQVGLAAVCLVVIVSFVFRAAEMKPNEGNRGQIAYAQPEPLVAVGDYLDAMLVSSWEAQTDFLLERGFAGVELAHYEFEIPSKKQHKN